VLQKLATQAFTINSGLTEVASITSPAGAPAATCATNTCTFAGLSPGTAYTFSVGAALRRTQTITITPGVGDTGTQTVTLVGRSVTVNVKTNDDGPDGNTNPDNPLDATFATVTLQIPTGTTVTQIVGDGSTANFTFSNIPFGAGQVSVAISGYRSRTFAIAADAGSDPSPISADMHQLVVFDGNVVDNNTPTGNPVGGATVTLTNADASITLTTTSASSTTRQFDKGEYRFNDIPQGVWTVTAVKDGTGAATSATISVTDTNITNITPVSVPDLVLQPRLTPRTIHVTEIDRVTAASSASVGTTVVVAGQPNGTTDASGNAVFQIPEDQALPAWSVAKSTFMPVASTDAGADPANVVLHPTPTITGIVSKGSPAVAFQGATVWFCTTAQPAAQCDSSFTPVPSPAVILATLTTDASGSYTIPSTLPVAAGTYRVKAYFKDTTTTPATIYTATFTITITATGTVTSPTGAGAYNLTIS